MRQYPLLHNNVRVGKVSVVQEGLYYRIVCICNQESLCDCSVKVETLDACVDLGKCAKESNTYALRRFISAKELGKGEFVFTLSDERKKQHIIVLDPIGPFSEIAQLPNCKFVHERSKNVVVIEE